MRLIGSIQDQDQAFSFSNYLKSKQIANSIEPFFNEQDGKASFEIWVQNEDQIEKASQYFHEFQKSPDDSKYKVEPPKVDEASSSPEDPPQPQPITQKPKKAYAMTYFWIALCGLVYLINFMQEVSLSKGKEVKFVALTPIQYYMLYDIPQLLIALNQWIDTYQVEPNQKEEDLSLEAKQALQRIEEIPTWRGAYDYILYKWIKKDTRDRFGPPTFQKIREGQVWRVFTPAILHKDFLHILFNMIWAFVLGKQIEERISRPKYFLMVVLVAIITNTAQYLMSGPYFLGYSGVVMGMAGFIWMRQRKAPWEGYPLHPSTFLFLAFFILAMLFLQVVSLFMQIFGSNGFAFNIANTAHIVGALVGMCLGKLSFYSWRPR